MNRGAGLIGNSEALLLFVVVVVAPEVALVDVVDFCSHTFIKGPGLNKGTTL
jgi:hypothetical protein